MAVNVHISLLAAEKDTEQLAAQELKKNFEYYFSNIYPEAEGDVYILHNVSVFGQLVRDIDLVVFANLKNYILNNVVTRNHGEVESLHIDNFVCNIELKDHTHDYIEHDGTSYFVTYPATRERKNATKQAHEQLHALRNYMHELSNIKSWVCDMVWFRSVSLEALNGIRRNRQDNALHSDFTFEDLARMFSQRSNVIERYDGFHLGGSSIDVEDNEKMVNLLCTPREPEGLSRKRQ